MPHVNSDAGYVSTCCTLCCEVNTRILFIVCDIDGRYQSDLPGFAAHEQVNWRSRWGCHQHVIHSRYGSSTFYESPQALKLG